MDKYKQLQEWYGRKYCKHFTIQYDEKYNGITLTLYKSRPPGLIVYKDNSFRINNLLTWYSTPTDRYVYVSCMPYPVIIEKRRNGWHINGYKWQENGLFFNSKGDCINAKPRAEDTPEKRKQFNKYMLNWTKVQIAMIRMTMDKDTLRADYATLNGLSYTQHLRHAHELFLETPSDLTWNYIKRSAYEINSVNKTVNNFRKRFQNELYEKYLKENIPKIRDFK